jgi:uncharacterized protein YjiS (DUF1127 family)
MRSLVSALTRLISATVTRRSIRRLAALDDHMLRDLGLLRTDLYALGGLHRSRLRAACCILGDVGRLLGGRTAACC